VPMPNLAFEEEDKKGEKIEGCNNGESKNTLLSISCRRVPKDSKKQAARIYQHGISVEQRGSLT
jgi:hypothetical protein